MYCVLTSEDDWRLPEWRDGTHADVATIGSNEFCRPPKGNAYRTGTKRERKRTLSSISVVVAGFDSVPWKRTMRRDCLICKPSHETICVAAPIAVKR